MFLGIYIVTEIRSRSLESAKSTENFSKSLFDMQYRTFDKFIHYTRFIQQSRRFSMLKPMIIIRAIISFIS